MHIKAAIIITSRLVIAFGFKASPLPLTLPTLGETTVVEFAAGFNASTPVSLPLPTLVETTAVDFTTPVDSATAGDFATAGDLDFFATAVDFATDVVAVSPLYSLPLQKSPVLQMQFFFWPSNAPITQAFFVETNSP